MIFSGEFHELGLASQADFGACPAAGGEVLAWEEGVWWEGLEGML